ncbi:glucoamylase [Kitasatospora phosalacinea]|uniref:Glucoamylase n=1 Tax=Kitasatospora phosalacinea TaxID=2065 RepID=A0A9W6V4G8_9ACTN|nr:glycoside hydrolase family 15 protein [Kitasatospora phosalacinea]GLW74716.1 glucoamylase [Kitasatospora phosalacinea]
MSVSAQPVVAPGLIEDHAVIGNTCSAALVHRDGAITWLCLPRFDSSALFASLLGTDDHGLWRIAPADAAEPPVRRYEGAGAVLVTDWHTATGTARVVDFMPTPAPGPGNAPAPQVIRIVEGLTGTVAMRSLARLRPGYGTTSLPLIRDVDDAGTRRIAVGSAPEVYWLDATAPVTVHQGDVRAEFTIEAGQQVVFALTHHAPGGPVPPVPDGPAALRAARAYWRTWTARCTYYGPDRPAVLRAATTLKLLCHHEGGIVAAPTTSLPEEIGGQRNWDYRYVWPRDSALSATALTRLGHLDEALAWRQWLTRTIATAGGAQRMQVIYALSGEKDLTERTLAHLPGYQASAPVRIGNGAAGQLQLDVFGEITDALWTMEQAGAAPDPAADLLLLDLTRQVEQRWRHRDEGIWEIRGPRRHFTHSKVMAWVAVDRTLRILERRPVVDTVLLANLHQLADQIHADVCANGYDPESNTFTQSYGSPDLDAALLLIPRVGFLPPDDKRVIGTVEAIQRHLTTPDGLIRRYVTREADNVDGLAGHEGAFLACSFWLADALHLIGRPAEAHDLTGRLLALRSDLGLLAEEYDPAEKRQLGNYPQGFSAWSLADSLHLMAAPLPLSEHRRADDALRV